LLNARISVQSLVVMATHCWLFWLTFIGSNVTGPQLKITVSVAPGDPSVWGLTKCQMPVPLHLVPTKSLANSAARAGVATATRASTDINNVKFVVRFICILF